MFRTMSSMNDDYIPVEEAASILRLGERQTRNYGAKGLIKTKRAGQRVVFHRGDVEALAEELGASLKPRPKSAQMEMIPPGEIFNYIQQRDQQVAELQDRLNQAALRIGQLQGELEAGRLLLEDKQRIQQRLESLEKDHEHLQQEREAWLQEKAQIEAELEHERQPWWRKFFG